MRTIQIKLALMICLALFMGACWARGTTVGVGETVPLGGTTTTTTTTTNTTTTTTQEEGSSEPTPQMQITPADGSTPSSTEGSGWENLGMIGSGDSAEGASASGDASGTGGTSATAQQNQQTGSAGGSGCLPALVLAGAALSLFVFRP